MGQNVTLQNVTMTGVLTSNAPAFTDFLIYVLRHDEYGAKQALRQVAEAGGNLYLSDADSDMIYKAFCVLFSGVELLK